MSGTSLDGLDIVYVKFDNKSYKNFEILASDTMSYPRNWEKYLQSAISLPNDKLQQLHLNYGKLLGEEVNRFKTKHTISDVSFIASHGHTVFHQPKNGITLQVGDGQELANTTKHKVVCNFRTQDVQLGGQGAPLVPIGDELLFSNYDCCINLGGFANISYKENNKRIAFDICPVNIVLNHYTRKIGLEYDNKGMLASEGEIHVILLEKLNSLLFYNEKAPKSLGLEWVQQEIFPLLDGFDLSVKDVLRTFTEHSAYQIGRIIRPNSSVLVTGGGVFNSFLMNRIEKFSTTKIELPYTQLIEYKEALIFAFLGLLRLKNEVNCLRSVTGAKRDHSSGTVFLPTL